MSINQLVPLVKERLEKPLGAPTALECFSGNGVVIRELKWNLKLISHIFPAMKENKKVQDKLEQDIAVFNLNPITDPEQIFRFINLQRNICGELNNSYFETPLPAIDTRANIETLKSGIYHASVPTGEIYEEDAYLLEDVSVPYHLVIHTKLDNGVTVIFLYKSPVESALYYFHPHEQSWSKVDFASEDFFVFEGQFEAFQKIWEEIKQQANAVPRLFDFEQELLKYARLSMMLFNSNQNALPRYRVFSDKTVYYRRLKGPSEVTQYIRVLVPVPGDDNGGIGITFVCETVFGTVVNDSPRLTLSLENDTNVFLNSINDYRPVTMISPAHIPRAMQREVCNSINRTFLQITSEIRSKSN